MNFRSLMETRLRENYYDWLKTNSSLRIEKSRRSIRNVLDKNASSANLSHWPPLLNRWID